MLQNLKICFSRLSKSMFRNRYSSFKVYPSLVVYLVNMYVTDTAFLGTSVCREKHTQGNHGGNPLCPCDRYEVVLNRFGKQTPWGGAWSPGLLALSILLDKSFEVSMPQFDDCRVWTAVAVTARVSYSPTSPHSLLQMSVASGPTTPVTECSPTPVVLSATLAGTPTWCRSACVRVSWPRTGSLTSVHPFLVVWPQARLQGHCRGGGGPSPTLGQESPAAPPQPKQNSPESVMTSKRKQWLEQTGLSRLTALY